MMGSRTGDEAEWAATGLFLAVETEGLGLLLFLGCRAFEMAKDTMGTCQLPLNPLLRHNPCSRPGIATVCGARYSRLYPWCDVEFLGEDLVRFVCLVSPQG